MIVIVATSDDLSMAPVIEALGRLGRKDVFRLDLETAFEDVSLSFRAGAGGIRWSVRSLSHPELKFDAESVSSVYWRRPVRFLGSPFLGIPTSENLDSLEVFWSIRWLLEALPERVFPFGHPHSFARGENKHRQLATAREIGFAVPETCHSNEIAVLEDFVSSQAEIAVKAMRMPAVSSEGEVKDARHIACRSFTSSFLLERLRKARRTQLYCQQTVHRKRDLRIMVFPQDTIAAEIDTSALAEGKLDWREHMSEIPHRIVPLDPAFERQLREFLRILGLSAGYFDFAVPETGPPVFFECNTNAGWFWIEHLTGHPISEAIARELARDHRIARDFPRG
jgi:hypothetical protein